MKIIFKKKQIVVQVDSALNKDGSGYMFYTPNVSVWRSGDAEGGLTWCITFNFAFWSLWIWLGNVNEIK